MKYPHWAPATVAQIHSELCKSKNNFQTQDHTKSDLERYAKKEGYRCWVDFEKSLTLQIAILERILFRQEMISVWEWIKEQNYSIPITAPGGIIGNLLRNIEDWDKSSKSASRDRDEDFKKIVNHAKKLSRLLQKYQGEKRQAFNYYSALIPRKYDLELKRVLHPDLKARTETRPEMLRLIWHQLLPPIEEIISGIARSVAEDDSKLPRNFPRKMAAPTAFRTYLINNLVNYVYRHTDDVSPSIIAIFMSVALDDASITVDTISKSETMKKIRKDNEDSG